MFTCWMKSSCGRSWMELPNSKLIFWSIFNSFCSAFQVGYHVSVINIPEDVFKNFTRSSYNAHYGAYLSDSGMAAMWGFLVTTYSLGAIIGAALTSTFAENLGRKNSIMLWNNIIALIASAAMAIAKWANSFEILAVGRTVIGLASGLCTGLLAVYLTEISPVRWRGLTGSFLNFFVTATSIFSAVFSLPDLLGTSDRWHYLLLVGVVPAVIQMLATPLCPESPKYLCVTLADRQRAAEAIIFYHGPEADVPAVLEEFDQEKELSQREVGFHAAFVDRNLRWPILVACVVNFTVVFTGLIAILSYSTQIFEAVHVGDAFSNYSTIIMTVCNTAGAFVGLFLMEKFNRRVLVLYCLSACVVLDIVYLIFSQILQATNQSYAAWVSLVSVLLLVTVFQLGPGPIAWFFSAEMTPQAARSVGASVAITTNWFFSALTSIIYPELVDVGKSWAFMMFIVPSLACTIFLWRTMPETRNRTIEQIMESWMTPEEISALKFKLDQHGQPNFPKPAAYSSDSTTKF